jgi:SAM-dependent methyltransferase
MTANEDQIRIWNDKAGQNWTQLQQRMDANLSPIHAAVMAFANAQVGEAVLDIGCGTGTTTLALADTVGASGSVLGVDVSRPMLELARSRAADRANVRFELADASAYPFTQQYELLFSRFGVMFFDDPIGAFANLHRALRPGGRLAFVCWRSGAQNLWATAPLAAAKPFLPEQPAPDPFAPGPFAFADPQRLLSILSDVGFHDVETRKYDGVMPMGRDLDAAAEQMLQIGPLARAVGDADPDAATRARIVDAARAALASFTDAEGEITPPTACWLVSARVA